MGKKTIHERLYKGFLTEHGFNILLYLYFFIYAPCADSHKKPGVKDPKQKTRFHGVFYAHLLRKFALGR